MKNKLYLSTLLLLLLNATKISEAAYLETERVIKPNLTYTEFLEFKTDVKKLTKPYSSGRCAKFATALLNNIHERHSKAFPQLSLRSALVKSRVGSSTIPHTVSSVGIIHAKRYRSIFENNSDYVEIPFKDLKNLPENTIIIAVYQPVKASRPGHIEVIFKEKNKLIAASDKIGTPSYTLKRLYKNAEYYYPVRQET
jgi:hypothetical protein